MRKHREESFKVMLVSATHNVESKNIFEMRHVGGLRDGVEPKRKTTSVSRYCQQFGYVQRWCTLNERSTCQMLQLWK